MGEDIHCKLYIKSKVGDKAGKYVSAMEVLPTFDTADDSDFKNLFDFRSYDFFSMLGSSRSNWRMLDGIHDGFPEWHAADFPTENAMLKLKGTNYYRFGWTTFRELNLALKDRMRQLSDVHTYYSEDPDKDTAQSILEIVDDDNSSESKNFVKQFNRDASSLSSLCAEILEQMSKIYDTYNDEEWRALFDVDDTVVLFWFDC